PYVRKKLELLLEMLAEKGEDYTFRYARRWMEVYFARQKALKHPCCCGGSCCCGGGSCHCGK
ncbi:MAG: hypothetical protein IJJ89_03410, partial [Eubacterium sp.]|nr:hypothetical protein [Eubacterium sp.]